MKRSLIFLALCFGLCLPLSLRAQVSLSKINTPYTQNFDSMARTGASTVMPKGWAYIKSNMSDPQYMTGKGDSSKADIYSYGATGFASRNRALGSISDGSNQMAFGASFKNNTGYTIGYLVISFTTEQWRLGATGRGADSTVFDYSTTADSLSFSDAGWTRIDGLDLISPVTSGTVGPLNGTTKLNQSTVSFKIDNLKIPAGATFRIRWKDIAVAGNNDGLAIDNFSITPGLLPGVVIYVNKIVDAKFPQTFGIPDTTVHGRFKAVVLSGNLSSGGLEFAVRDNTGSIMVEAPAGAFGYKPSIGDSVYLGGKVQSYNYLTYLALDSFYRKSGGSIPSSRLVTRGINNDSLESDLVTVNGLTLSATALWDTTGAGAKGGFVVNATTAGFPPRNYGIFISSNTNVYTAAKPNFPFNITGIVIQSSQNPANGYYIIPRSRADFDTLPQPKLPLYKIAEIKGNRKSGIADSLNVKCYLKGIVNSVNFSLTGYEFSIVDNTGAIMVMGVQPLNAYAPKEGDSVMVRGTIGQLRGLTDINIDDIKYISGSHPLTAPVVLTTSAAFGESQESYPVEVRNVRLLDATQWDTTAAANKAGFTVQVRSKTDTFSLYIVRATDLYFHAAIQGAFDVAGIAIQSKTGFPLTGGYEIIPRGISDVRLIKINSGPLPFYKISQIKPYNIYTGIADSTGVACFLKGIVLSNNLSPLNLIAYSIYDNTAAITVTTTNTAYNPAISNIGDSILVRGIVAQRNGLTIFNADSSAVLSKGNSIKSPTVLNVMEEGYESDLVEVQDVMMADSTQWDTTAAANKLGFTIKVYHNIDTFYVRISRATDIYARGMYHGSMSITGIELQDKAKAPFTSGYYIAARSTSDIKTMTGIRASLNDNTDVSVFPNPVSGRLYIRSDTAINRLTLMDVNGRKIIEIYPEINNTSIDMSSLKAGVYILQMQNGRNIITNKVFRQ